MRNRIILLLLAAALSFCCISCGPPPATKDITFGVWMGSEKGSKGRVMVTFIAPNKVEMEYVDDKERKKETGTWEVKEGAVHLTREGKTSVLKLSYIDQNDERKEKLATADGELEVVKV